MEGFEAFELLRPTDGKDVFYVYTRWRSTEDFDRWLNSQAFRQGHAQHTRRAARSSTGSELLAFDVVHTRSTRAGGRRSRDRSLRRRD